MTVFLLIIFLIFVGYEMIMLMEQVTHARRRQSSRKTCEAFRRARK